MSEPGFEPVTSSVWDERDDQLLHPDNIAAKWDEEAPFMKFCLLGVSNDQRRKWIKNEMN